MISMAFRPCGGPGHKRDNNTDRRNPETADAQEAEDEIDVPELNAGLSQHSVELSELGLSEKIFILLCSPRVNVKSSVYYWSTVIDKIILAAITVGCVCFIISTLPDHRKPYKVPQYLITIEFITYILFTAEYFPRMLCGPYVRWDILNLTLNYWPSHKNVVYPEDYRLQKFWVCFIDPMNLLDFFAIIPYWVAEILQSELYGATVVFRLFRLVRITRVFQIFFKNGFGRREGRILWQTISHSFGQILRLALYYGIAAFVFGTMIFYAEMGEYKSIDNAPEAWMVKTTTGEWTQSQFHSILDGAWWFLVTGTSVGYGDIYPYTNLGRMIATIAIMIGLITIALPIGIIQTQFYTLQNDPDAHMRRLVNDIFDQREEKLREMFAEQEEKIKLMIAGASFTGMKDVDTSTVDANTVID